MKHVPSTSLLRALQGIAQSSHGCRRACLASNAGRYFHGASISCSFRKPVRSTTVNVHQVRGKKTKTSAATPKVKAYGDPRKEVWELTVGIEIHAELNTAGKLFSPAQTSLAASPNTHVSVYDAAEPGAQPGFQKETLLPALRAAIALGCEIQPVSSWDRKHYFWWDQPNGYQITQYYQPFARDGSITLFTHDDIDPTDGEQITIGIKQVQMEQDTAKTVVQPPATQLLDFNRVSHPLIEIITLPQIHSPKTAAAVVRKIQSILFAVSANTTGMELGGLRADVNVSTRRRDAAPGTLEYGGVYGLGQRTEIKNLSSFKAVEDAISSEWSRQIRVLDAGGVIEGETRGWSLGSTETVRLRGKEGEVDYRYMPDPDLGELRISEQLVNSLRETMPMVPDETLKMLTEEPYCLTVKDAKTLAILDNGDRLDYYLDVVRICEEVQSLPGIEKLAANWVLMDLPSHLSAFDVGFPYCAAADHGAVTAPLLADILRNIAQGQINNESARRLLSIIHNTSPDKARHLQSVSALIDQHGLRLNELRDEEYADLVRSLVAEHGDMARKALQEASNAQARSKGKIMWFVGQMVRKGGAGRVQPLRAETFVRRYLLAAEAA